MIHRPNTERRPALGKGLSALIPDTPIAAGTGPIEVGIDELSPNGQQPRVLFDDSRLDELAHSIRNKGIIQPILVRRAGNGFRIIAGERRWRAARKAGLARVPIVIRDLGGEGDKELLELALIENIQRENLNPIDEASAYLRLLEEHGLTQEEVAAAIGKDRSSIANFLRLLKLDNEVKALVAAGTLSMGHARALLAVADGQTQRQVAADVVSQGLSVRQTEALARKTAVERRSRSTSVERQGENDVHTKAAEARLRFVLGTRVRIVRRGDGGTIEVDFSTETELNRLYELLTATR